MNEVILAARVRGAIARDKLRSAIQRAGQKHPSLCSHVNLDQDGQARFVNDGTIQPSIEVLTRTSNQSWIQYALNTAKHPFNIETGPLIRFALISDNRMTDLVIYCHHVICDGLSLSYLMQDLLEVIADPSTPTTPPLALPLVVRENFPNRYRPMVVVRWYFSRLNKKWASQRRVFTGREFEQMFAHTWKDKTRRVFIHEFSPDVTQGFVNRCKAEGVTVNSAVFAAMVKAENEVLHQNRTLTYKLGLAIDLRDKLTVPVGKALGLYAGAFSTRVRCRASKPFWDLCRLVHSRIRQNFREYKIYAVGMLNLIEPNLLDAMYFQEAGMISIPTAQTLSNTLGIHKPTVGVGITNLRMIRIPERYGNLTLESLTFIPPCVMNYKIIMGLCTFGGKMVYSLSYWEPNISEKEVTAVANQIEQYVTSSAS